VEQLRSSIATASDIRHRLSPFAIKAITSAREVNAWSMITTTARRNPMQAVAVGASVAARKVVPKKLNTKGEKHERFDLSGRLGRGYPGGPVLLWVALR
jgi:hypothetical protein